MPDSFRLLSTSCTLRFNLVSLSSLFCGSAPRESIPLSRD